MVKKLIVLRLSSLLLTLAIMLCFTGVASADVDTTTSKFEPNVSIVGNATYNAFASYIAAQTFTVLATHDVSYISIYGYIEGDPEYVTMQLVNVTDGNITTAEPTRNLVYRLPYNFGSSASEKTLASSYFTSDGNGSWIDFTLPKEIRLQPDKIYAVVVKAPRGANGNDSYHWFYNDEGAVYGNGTAWTSSNNGGTWSVQANDDFMFEVYGRSGLLIAKDDTTGNLTGVSVFRDFHEEGDWLVAIAYQNKAPPYYGSDDIEQYFRVQLINNVTGNVTGETVLRAWDAAPASIYLNASEASDEQWGGNYSVKITATYGGNFYIEEELQDMNWYGSSLNWLDRWCISKARWMGLMNENNVDEYITKVGNGWVLNTAGMTLFNLGIPGLGEERGQYLYEAFVVGEGIVLPSTGTANPVLQSKYSWTTSLGATLVAALDDFGTPFSLSGKQVALAVTLALYVAVVGGSFPLGHGTAGTVAGFFVILIGMIAGVIDVIWVVLAAAIAWIFVLRQLILTST